MKGKILDILAENYPEIDFESSDELVDDGTLDSLTVVGIISVLSAEFDVELPYEEIVPENFNSWLVKWNRLKWVDKWWTKSFKSIN